MQLAVSKGVVLTAVPDLGRKVYIPCGNGSGVRAVKALLLLGFSNTPSAQTFLMELINSANLSNSIESDDIACPFSCHCDSSH